MKTFLAILVTVAFGLGMMVHAQSRRTPPSQSDQKPNQRERAAEPTPTPTPLPEEDAEPDDGEVISVDTNLVTVPVRVLDRKNRFIGGLSKENFSLYEDNVEQDMAYFSNEAQPFTVALVLDMSYSATFKIEEIQNAAMAFIAQLRPEDQVMIISFDEEVHIHCDPTTDRKTIYSAIRSTKIATGTSLYEAVDQTMNVRMRSIKGRKAIVLFTDGVDTTSRATNDVDNLRDAMELDSLIYPVRYDTYSDVQAMKRNPPVNVPPGIPLPDSPSTRIPPGTPGTLPTNFPFPIPTNRNPGPSRTPDPRGGTRPDYPRDDRDDPSNLPPSRPPIGMPGQRGTTAEEYRYAEEYLNQLALRTGGRVHLATSYGNLVTAFAKIASELREFYSIGYYPKQEGEPGRTKRIKVRVNQENLVVRARDSYVVPKNQKRAPSSTR